MSVNTASAEGRSGRPVSAPAFAAALDALCQATPAAVAVAVSGGADSMALTLLAADWAKARGIRMTALTVDHRLRAESASEAQNVRDWLTLRGIAHETLAWTEGERVRHLDRSAQDAARDGRYALLTAWCKAHGCGHLLLAHHADDQIETFFLRLSRGSGLQGLGAMDPVSSWRGVVLLRPLLSVAKEDLTATCAAAGQVWIEDPSNTNAKYARTRFRQTRAILEAEGLSRERMLMTIASLQRARTAVTDMVARLSAEACVFSDGQANLSAVKLYDAPEEVGLRLLSDVLCRVGDQLYGPRFERLQRLFGRLREPFVKGLTLHGCVVSRAGPTIRVIPERERRGGLEDGKS